MDKKTNDPDIFEPLYTVEKSGPSYEEMKAAEKAAEKELKKEKKVKEYDA